MPNSKTYTIENFISSKSSDEITYYNTSILSKSILDDGLLYSSNNIIYTYLDEIKRYCVTATMSENEYIKYKYKPKLLAYDLYGSTELFFIILAINGICNIKDFDMKTLLLIPPEQINTIISSIYNAESTYISYNRNKINN